MISLLGEGGALRYPEAVLLIRYNKPQLPELNRFVQDGMRSHQKVNAPLFQLREQLTPPCRRNRTGEQRYIQMKRL